jgi:foldase protein PrsA
MKSIRWLLIVSLALSAACAEMARPTAATVDGTTISAAQVTDALERFEASPQFDQLAQQSDPSTARRQFEQAYLGQQIRRLVLRPRARELGVEVTDEVVDERLEQIKGGFPSEKEFRQALEDRGFTEAELQDLVRDQIIEEQLQAEVTAAVEPSEAELEQYYRSHRRAYQQTRVQHILVKKQELARRISQQLRAVSKSRGKVMFARLAKRYSTDESNADNAGKLGWVSPGQLVEPFEIAMNGLRAGEVSLPVPTDFGIHVIRVTGRRAQPFEEVRAQVQQQVGGDAAETAWQEWIEDAYRRADVEVNPRYGELNPASGQISDPTASDVPGASESSPEG